MPAIQEAESSRALAVGLQHNLTRNEELRELLLQNMVLRPRDSKHLAAGLALSSLETLSLRGCKIGDQGLDQLCQGIRSAKQLRLLCLQNNQLSDIACGTLAIIIGHFSTSRRAGMWQDSLRGRNPDTASSAGLKKIDVSNNPMIKDAGVRVVSSISTRLLLGVCLLGCFFARACLLLG
jgi:centrosomal protein CEP78